LTKSIIVVAVLTLLASPLIAAQDIALAHGSFRDTWIWWVGLIGVVAVFAWAAVASTERKHDASHGVEARVLGSLRARDEISQQDYSALSHDLEAQARDEDEDGREKQ